MKMKKWIVVTGASSGIGRNTALRLLNDGYCVVVTSRNKQSLTELYDDFENAYVISWDLSETGNLDNYAKEVKQLVGEISGFVHCAGIQATLPIHMIKEKKLLELFNINTFAAMLLISAFSKKGMTDGAASFVLISSLAAHEGAFGLSAYAASKGALEGFIHSCAPELAKKGIRINGIAPGAVETEMQAAYLAQLTEEQLLKKKEEYPLGLGKPEDISELISYLLTDKSRWITGQTIIIDGGHLVRKC